MTELRALQPSPADDIGTLPPSPGELSWRRAKRHPGLIIGLSVVSFVVLVALFAPWITPHDPYAQDLGKRLIEPVWTPLGSWDHILGTDSLGRDLLSRLMYGARISLSISFGAALISAVIGTVIGIIGGYFGGRVDAVVTYLINVKLSLPALLVAVAVIAVIGATPLILMLVIGALVWDRYAVVIRSAVQQLRNQEFVLAARMTGASHRRVLFSELLPNITSHIIVIVSLELGIVILIEAILSFLGLGIQPPNPSWGLLVAEGRNFMFLKPYLVIIPGLTIFFLVVAINLAGDGLRDILTPEGRS